MIAAFSRSISPIRPRSLEIVTLASGISFRTISRARNSPSRLTGANIPVIATAFRPKYRNRFAASRTARSSRGTISDPSYSWPPRINAMSPLTTSTALSGQSIIGGSPLAAGSPSRITPTGSRWERCTKALVKCVVPRAMTSMLLPLFSFVPKSC